MSRIVSWFWDDYGPTGAGIGSAIVVVLVAVIGLYWWAWPKDAKGNPLPCTQYVTTYVPITITSGKTTTVVIEPVQSCVAWASPTPSGPKGG